MDSVRSKPKPNHLPLAASSPDLAVATKPIEYPFTAIPTTPWPPEQPLAPKTKLQGPTRKLSGALWKKSLLVLLILLLTAGLFFAFLIWRGISASAHIQITGSTKEAPSLSKKLESLRSVFLPGKTVILRGEEKGRINILLLGKAGQDAPGKDLTDTIMLASINTQEKKVALLSLPRDLYLTLPEYQFGGKINTLYQFGMNNNLGTQPLSSALLAITGEPVDYFFIIDFDGFEETINALSGITVEVPKDFYDPRYPGKNYSYETFELKKGWQKLDGATALKYVRERHDDPEGDFGRAKRQQQVLEAVKNKVLSPGTYFNFLRVVKLFESVENNIKTDINLEEMRGFYELTQLLDTQNITNKVIDAWQAESLLRVSHEILGGTRAFVLVPRTGNWQETKTLAQNIFTLDALAERTAKIKAEQTSLLILDNGKTMQSADKLARYLEREFSFETKILYAPTLKQKENRAILVSRSGLSKPYSFDELLQRLPVTKEEQLPTLPSDAPVTDFVLTMNETLGEIFLDGDELFRPELEEAFLEH
jgi:LCP family protein required for cell wall assembly